MPLKSELTQFHWWEIMPPCKLDCSVCFLFICVHISIYLGIISITLGFFCTSPCLHIAAGIILLLQCHLRRKLYGHKHVNVGPY